METPERVVSLSVQSRLGRWDAESQLVSRGDRRHRKLGMGCRRQR